MIVLSHMTTGLLGNTWESDCVAKELNNSHCLVMSRGSEVVGRCISPVFMMMLV